MSTAPMPSPVPPIAPLVEVPKEAARPSRLASLDIFRGMTIAAMLLVNNPGSWGAIYPPLKHAPWHGWTPTDLIFPFFLFIMGVAVPFSLGKRSAEGGKGELFLHILTRGLALFLLGVLGYAVPIRWPDAVPQGYALLGVLRVVGVGFLLAAFVALLWPWRNKHVAMAVPPVVGILFLGLLLTLHFVNRHALAAGIVPPGYEFGDGFLLPYQLRIPGVLQRIGICYVVAASLALFTNWRTVAAASLLLMGAYAAAMLAIPYPSLAEPGQWVQGLLGPKDNLARYIDETLLGTHAYKAYPDPEGILSTLPAIASALLGVLAGYWLRTSRPLAERCAGLLAFGVLATLAGHALDGLLMPINKQLWTPSFTVFCAGMSLLGLGTVFFIVDLHQRRAWGLPFLAYGMNAIFAFVLAGILGRLTLLIKWTPEGADKPIALKTFLAARADEMMKAWAPAYVPEVGSLAYAVGYVLLFLGIMLVMHRAKVFLKV